MTSCHCGEPAWFHWNDLHLCKRHAEEAGVWPTPVRKERQ